MLAPMTYVHAHHGLPAGSRLYHFMCNKDMKERLVVAAFCDVNRHADRHADRLADRHAGSPKHKIEVRPPRYCLLERAAPMCELTPARLPDRSALVVR